MGLMDKIKNMFTEEEIVEEPIKKEVIQVEIPAASPKKEEKIEPKVEEPVIKPQKQEEKFIFPVYFDDDDFTTMDKKNKEEKKYREEKRIFEEKRYDEKKYEEKKIVTKPISDSYKGKVQEEKKMFKPTPIISPVYGVLDKNYTKDDITTRKHKDESKRVDDVDIIRNKAYGTLEDEMVDSLNYKEVHTNSDMEEYHKKMNEVDFNEMLEDSLDTNLDELESKLSKVSKEKEEKPKYSRTRKKELEAQEINENDLFDMIDTMYEEEK